GPGAAGARLAVDDVELEAEDGLGASDFEREVGAEAGARVPLTVILPREVRVVDVVAARRDLVEQTVDRHLRSRRLGECRGREHSEDGDQACDCCGWPSHALPPQLWCVSLGL